MWSFKTVAPGAGLRERLRVLRGIKEEGRVTEKFMQARCDRGAEIARMLFLSPDTADAIRCLDEHWDGRGMPAGLRGDEIPVLARILCLSQTVEVFHASGGVDAARRVARRRSGRWFDPEVVKAFERICGDRAFWSALAVPDVTAWEPAELVLRGDDARLDRIAEAFARVIDAKSPFTARHSERVAEIAAGLGEALGFDAAGRTALRRAGLLHDIGKLAISSRILDKPGRLTDEEFTAIKAHPVHSLRILERAPCFAPLADLAANHHEKLDGSGYPRRLDAAALDLPMRVLAVADVFEALTADRPYRGPMPPEKAVAIISEDVPGKLDVRVRDALEGELDRAADPLRGITVSVRDASAAPQPARPGPRDCAPRSPDAGSRGSRAPAGS